MKLNAAVKMLGSETEAIFEDKDGQVAQLAFANEETTSFDAFVKAIDQGAAVLKMSQEEVVKSLAVVRVSIPAVVDTILNDRRGTRIGLIVTEGKETTFPSRSSNTDALFNSVISDEMVVAVREDVSSHGQQMVAPDRDEIRDKVRHLLEYGAGALVVAFRNSGLNPVNEKTVKDFIESDYPRHYLGAVPVFISSDFGSSDDLQKMRRCLHNVYCWAGVDDALSRMETYLRERKFVGSFLITHGNGVAVPRADVTPLNTSDLKASHD